MDRASVFADVRTIEHNGETFYLAGDLGKLIGLKHISTSIAIFPNSYKHSVCVQSKGGLQKSTFISWNGVRRLLVSSRRTSAKNIAQALGIDILDVKAVSTETYTISCIKDAFPGETMIEQHRVGQYMIDLYFPKHRIAIECDEDFHSTSHNPTQDYVRQQFINVTLGCTFIRYTPNKLGFSIFTVIGEIYSTIRKQMNVLYEDTQIQALTLQLEIEKEKVQALTLQMGVVIRHLGFDDITPQQHKEPDTKEKEKAESYIEPEPGPVPEPEPVPESEPVPAVIKIPLFTSSVTLRMFYEEWLIFKKSYNGRLKAGLGKSMGLTKPETAAWCVRINKSKPFFEYLDTQDNPFDVIQKLECIRIKYNIIPTSFIKVVFYHYTHPQKENAVQKLPIEAEVFEKELLQLGLPFPQRKIKTTENER